MDKVKRYEFEGEVIEVPVYWDDDLQREAEEKRHSLKSALISDAKEDTV